MPHTAHIIGEDLATRLAGLLVRHPARFTCESVYPDEWRFDVETDDPALLLILHTWEID